MKQPEGIILAFSNIREDNLKHLNPELQKIRDVLKDAEEKNHINIIEHNGVTYNSLSYLLNSGKGKEVTMLHFSGHSSKNGLWVQSRNEHGIISKKPLTNLIKAHRKFRFVFLNSCYSKDIAQELINAGVPYVIGTIDRVNDEQSAVVAAKFYSLLAKSGKTIEEAFLLTKDYIDDPFNDNDTNIKEAFRTFDIADDNKSEYPWQLYQSPELKDKDKSWVLNSNPVKDGKKKLYILAGTIGVIILLLLVFKIYKQNENNITDTTVKPDTFAHSSEIKDRDSLKEIARQNDLTAKQHAYALKTGGKKTDAPGNHSVGPSPSVTKKQETSRLPSTKTFAQLKIVTADREYNNNITAKVREIFVEKGYLFGEAGAQLQGENYDNLVSGKFLLSAPVKTNGPFNTVIVEYTLRLTLSFFDAAGKRTCGQREYSAKISTTESDSKERVTQQGLNDILELLQKDMNFPFCVKK